MRKCHFFVSPPSPHCSLPALGAGVQPPLVRGAGSVKAGSVVLVPAGLTRAGCVSAGLGSSNSTDFLKTVPPVIIFIPELSYLVIQRYAVPSYLQIKQAAFVSLLSFLPQPLFPSCLLLRFILDKHTHLNIMVTISTSKHRISSLSYGLLILCYIMVN